MQNHQSTKWHVLIVQPRSERKVGLRLEARGFETCVPIQRQLRQWSDRKKWVDIVLFPNYVFLAGDPRRMNEVYEEQLVYRFLEFGGRLAVLTPQELAWVRQLAGLSLPVTITSEKFQVGQAVEVLSGPMTGIRGRVVSEKSGDKLQISFPSLGCFAEVAVGSNQVRMVGCAVN